MILILVFLWSVDPSLNPPLNLWSTLRDKLTQIHLDNPEDDWKRLNLEEIRSCQYDSWDFEGKTVELIETSKNSNPIFPQIIPGKERSRISETGLQSESCRWRI